MEIRRWHFYHVITYAVFVPHLVAKSVSLNKIIAAETQQNEDFVNSSRIDETTDERVNQVLTTPSIVTSQKSKGPVTSLLDKRVPLLKYRKTYEIKSPLKVKKLKRGLNPRYKHKNKSIKRDVHEYEKFNQKYIPLLKSVGMLFNNLLDADSSETFDTRTSKYKHSRDQTGERKRVVCSCALRSESEQTDSNETTITSTSTVTPEVSTIPEDTTITETSTAPSDPSALSDVSGLRQNKDIPVLLPRNTFSFRRDDNGHSEGGGTAYNGDFEGNIARDYGDGEYFTNIGENGSDTGSNEENTNSDSRDDASSDRSRGIRGSRNVPPYTRYRNTAGENEEHTKRQGTNEPVGLTRHLELKRENKQQIRGDQTKGTKHVSEFIRRLRGSLSQNKVGNISKSLQSEEYGEESIVNDTYIHTSTERFPEGGGTNTSDDQKVCTRYEELKLTKDVYNLGKSVTPRSGRKTPVIMIIDGYSVMRDKNGENKLSEKSVRLHS